MRKTIFIFTMTSAILSFSAPDNKIKRIEETKKEILNDTIQRMTEADAYKLLYQNQMDANDDILKTIFYALGGLGTAVLLVFGSNWYFNHQKVKDAMNDIDSKVKQIKSDFQTETADKLSAIKSELLNEISQNQATILSNFNSRNDSFRTEIKNDIQTSLEGFQELIHSYNDNSNQQFIAIKEIIEEKVNTLNKQIELSENRVDKKHSSEAKFIKRDILRQKADLSTLKGNKNVALKDHTDFAIYDLREFPTLFKYSSDGVIKSLSEVAFLYDDEKVSIEELLELAQENYSEITKQITELYKDKEIRTLSS